MEFASFDQALAVCINAEDGTDEQEEAMHYCIEHAPPELREEIKRQFLAAKEARALGACSHDHHSCSCGCD